MLWLVKVSTGQGTGKARGVAPRPVRAHGPVARSRMVLSNTHSFSRMQGGPHEPRAMHISAAPGGTAVASPMPISPLLKSCARMCASVSSVMPCDAAPPPVGGAPGAHAGPGVAPARHLDEGSTSMQALWRSNRRGRHLRGERLTQDAHRLCARHAQPAPADCFHGECASQ